MYSFVHERAMDYCSGEQFLLSLRQVVTDLRKCHPELQDCTLADLSLRKLQSVVSVTLYFTAKH